MQDLVDAVRDTGADNPIPPGGLAYANDLSQWLTYRPTDPASRLAAAGLSAPSTPALITAYDGTPTSYGIGLRDPLRALDGQLPSRRRNPHS